jgi:inositol transport system ATP-binding protein
VVHRQAQLILEGKNISKSFSGVRVLEDVSIRVEPGTVHVLVGENGAGKSTLMKILARLLPPDSGEVVSAERASVAMIHQELMPFPDLSVAENIAMGREPVTRLPGWIDRAAMRRDAVRLLETLGADLDPDRKMRGLSVAAVQMVEIAKALARNASVVLMDEPTSALPAHETEALFAVVAELVRRGVAVVYTSHKMDEIFRIAHTITVLRDGRLISTGRSEELDERRLIALMVGRDLEVQPGTAGTPGAVALEVRGLGKAGEFRKISLTLRRGEITGVAGLMGSGRTELASAIFGLTTADDGEIVVNGRAVKIRHPADAMRCGIAMVTEDRKESGIIPTMSLKQNLSLAALRRVCRGPWIDGEAETRMADAQVRAFGIRARDCDQQIRFLSGGNQQKALIARALLTQPGVVIFDEPTRGIDIGAKSEIHGMMRSLARDGKAILMISSEMPEILAVSDRILVMREGMISAELDPRRTTEEEILRFAIPN